MQGESGRTIKPAHPAAREQITVRGNFRKKAVTFGEEVRCVEHLAFRIPDEGLGKAQLARDFPLGLQPRIPRFGIPVTAHESPAAGLLGDAEDQFILPVFQWQIHGVVISGDAEKGRIAFSARTVSGVQEAPIAEYGDGIAVAETELPQFIIVGTDHRAREHAVWRISASRPVAGDVHESVCLALNGQPLQISEVLLLGRALEIDFVKRKDTGQRPTGNCAGENDL